MQDKSPATKITRVITRADGSQIKIVAQTMFGAGLTPSTDVYALRREHADDTWKLLSDRPHPDWRKMSVDEYKQNGRSEMLQAVSIGEILKITSLLGRPMTDFSPDANQHAESIKAGECNDECQVRQVERPR